MQNKNDINLTEIHDELVAYCSWNNSKNVKNILQKYKQEINVLYDDGTFFDLAIARKSQEILELLLAHYKTHHLQGSTDSIEYKIAKFRLKETLEEVIDGDTPQEMLEILKPYLRIAPNSNDEISKAEYKDDDEFSIDIDYNDPFAYHSTGNDAALESFEAYHNDYMRELLAEDS